MFVSANIVKMMFKHLQQMIYAEMDRLRESILYNIKQNHEEVMAKMSEISTKNGTLRELI